MSTIQQIYDKYPLLTPKQQSVIDFLLENPQDACYISLKKLSQLTHASEVSVLRTCTALGYEGFVQLKEAFRQYCQNGSGRGLPIVSAIAGSDNQEPTLKEMALMEICGEESMHLEEFVRTLDRAACFDEARALMSAGEVFVFGHDVSKVFADYICHRLTFLRIKASSIMLGDGSTVQSILARIRPGDHAIFLSFPPYHLPAVTSAKYASKQGASVTVLTDSTDSPAIIEGSRHFICNTNTRFFYNSHTLIMALINLLASCIAIEMGHSYKDILVAEQAVEGYMKSDSEGSAAGKRRVVVYD